MNKCWYCGKELKNENDKEHIGICDKCYQESFKVGNTVLTKLIKYKTDKDQKIADLEAKLAEKDQELNDTCQNYDFQLNDFSREIYRLQQREKVLEQQLAEKEKEKELDNSFWKQECDSLQKALAEKEKSLEYFRDRVDKADKEIKEIYGKYNEAVEDYNNLKEEVEVNFVDGKVCDQVKTDFAIEQLEKVKEDLKTFDFNYNGSIDCCEDDVFIIFDNQIKAIKEKK